MIDTRNYMITNQAYDEMVDALKQLKENDGRLTSNLPEIPKHVVERLITLKYLRVVEKRADAIPATYPAGTEDVYYEFTDIAHELFNAQGK